MSSQLWPAQSVFALSDDLSTAPRQSSVITTASCGSPGRSGHVTDDVSGGDRGRDQAAA